MLGDSPASNSLIGNLSFNTLQFINFCLHPCRLCNTSASDLNKIPSINVNDGLETIEWPFRIKDDTFSLIDNIHSGLVKDFETSLKNEGLCYYPVTLSCNYYTCSNYISLRFGKQTWTYLNSLHIAYFTMNSLACSQRILTSQLQHLQSQMKNTCNC